MSVSENGGSGDHRFKEGVVARMALKVLEIAMVGRKRPGFCAVCGHLC